MRDTYVVFLFMFVCFAYVHTCGSAKAGGPYDVRIENLDALTKEVRLLRQGACK